MGKNLTPNQKAEVAKSTSKTRLLITIELAAPFWILANDSVGNITIGGNTYYTRLVETTSVEESLDGSSEKIDIAISDIAQEFAALIADNGDVLTNTKCKIEQIIFEGDSNMIIDNPVLLFEGLINDLQLSQKYCTFAVERELYNPSALSPNMTYDVNCQFKFKDSRCQYSGTETKCDKTLSRCQALGHVERFGGYPSVIVPVSYS